MPDWFKAVTQRVRPRGSTSEERPTFSLMCTCGTRLSGARTAVFQRVPCPRCKAHAFALPASVYPAPRPPPAGKGTSKSSSRDSGANSVQSPSRPSPNTAEPAVKSRARAARGERAPESSRVDLSWIPGGQVACDLVVALAHAVAHMVLAVLQVATPKWWTPLRRVVAALLITVALTGTWMWRARGRQHAETTFAAAVAQGDAALQEDDFLGAFQAFRDASNAATNWGLHDPRVAEVRQLALETEAAAELVTKSLEEILSEALEIQQTDARAEWPDLFRQNYRGSWVVIDATVQQIAGTPPTWLIDFPIVAETVQAQVVGNLPAFERLAEQGEPLQEPRRVVFAAQLADCRPDPARTGMWQFFLQPETAFLWSGQVTFQKLGFLTDPATAALLAQQTQVLEVMP